jgi:hypothetical protein
MRLTLQLRLLSDTTFGSGDGLAGLVDAEVEQDAETGLPCIKGRTLRGLMVEECADLLEAVRLQNEGRIPWPVERAARTLFGVPGSTDEATGSLHVGPAQLPADLRATVRQEIEGKRLTREEALSMTTCIRRQTAMDGKTDAPVANSLRSQRAVVRDTRFEAELLLSRAPVELELSLLAACTRAIRRGGTGRNRGRGALECRLHDTNGSEVPADALFDFLVAGEGNR